MRKVTEDTVKENIKDFVCESERLENEYEDLLDMNSAQPLSGEMRSQCAQLIDRLVTESVVNEDVNTTADMKAFQEMIIPLFRKGFANISLLPYVGVQVINQANSAFYLERFYYAGNKTNGVPKLLANKERTGDADFRTKILRVIVDDSQYAQITAGTSVIKVSGGTGNALATVVYKELGSGGSAKLMVKLADGETLPAPGGNVYITVINGDVSMTHVWNNQVGRHVILSTYGGPMITSEGENLADFNRLKINIESLPVTAMSHKLGFEISTEMLSDMMKQHGEDAKKRIINAVQWQFAAQINMKLYNLMTSSAEIVTGWTYATADGRHETEKFNSLLRKISYERNRIGARNTVGRANFAIVSQGVGSIVEGRVGFIRELDNEAGAGFVKIGSLDGITYLLDTWAVHEYCLLGFKAKDNNQNAGVFYCPYIPIQVDTTSDPDLPSRKIILFTERSGYQKNPYGANEYLTYFDVNLTGSSYM